MAETERTINGFITSISLKLALAAAEWASKFLEHFNPADINEIKYDVALAAAAYPHQGEAKVRGGGGDVKDSWRL